MAAKWAVKVYSNELSSLLIKRSEDKLANMFYNSLREEAVEMESANELNIVVK
jgi:hypothetical protein